ncbi:hypothetical protein Dimus_004366 [Dionaea muscipula]
MADYKLANHKTRSSVMVCSASHKVCLHGLELHAKLAAGRSSHSCTSTPVMAMQGGRWPHMSWPLEEVLPTAKGCCPRATTVKIVRICQPLTVLASPARLASRPAARKGWSWPHLGDDARGKPPLAKWWLAVATEVDGKPAPWRNCWPHRGCARCLAVARLYFMNTHRPRARSWHAAHLYMLPTYTTVALLPMDELLVWSYTLSWQRGGALIAAQADQLWQGGRWPHMGRPLEEVMPTTNGCCPRATTVKIVRICQPLTVGWPRGSLLAAEGDDARGKPLLAKWWLAVATEVDGKPVPWRNCWPHRGCARCLAAACLCFMNTHCPHSYCPLLLMKPVPAQI